MGEITGKASIAVVGGGITGIAAALQLAESGKFQVTLFEKEDHLGGLNSFFRWDHLICDRFYHIILPGDSYLLGFIKALGIDGNIFWRKANTGFFADQKLVPLSSLSDFIRFPFLSFAQKIRLGLGVVYIARLKSLSRLDQVYAPQWLSRVFGKKIYDKIWEPLLRGKLGEATSRTSAAFMWATIRRLYGARNSINKQEKLGYLHGGLHGLVGAARKKLEDKNVLILTAEPVLEIRQANGDDIKTSDAGAKTKLRTRSGWRQFDKVLLTMPAPEILKIIGTGDHPYWKTLQSVEYLGVVSLLIIASRSLSRFYVINLLEQEFPFTGIVETTNIIAPKEFQGKHLIYLPKYVTGNDPFMDLGEGEISRLFIEKLKTVFPRLTEADILQHKVFYEKYVQPIQKPHFLANRIAPITPLQGVYLANTAMIHDTLHNNNANLKLVQDVVDGIMRNRRNDSARIVSAKEQRR